MFVRTQKSDCPASFPFPFRPYSIQDQFMRSLYSVIENRKIGIFESPTGTGKTLSLMCSTLKWLNDHNELTRLDLEDKIQKLELEIKGIEEKNAKSIDWLSGQFDSLQKKEVLNRLRDQLGSMNEYELKVNEMRKKWKNQCQKRTQTNKTKKKFTESKELLDEIENANEKVVLDDAELIIEDIEVDEMDNFDEIEDAVEKRFQDTKIYFCSRTHSQLSQAINEIKKTIYGSSIRIIQMASRQQLCINPEVRHLKSNALINERCLELKKGKSKSTCCQQTKQTQADSDGRSIKRSKVTKAKSTSCPFYAQAAIQNVSELALYNAESIMDIEDLVEIAKEEKGCPYYAARNAAKDAQVIMLPYQMLLHKKTRDQLDINIKDSIVIIDEAHNLLDTIASIHSAEITADQLQRVHQQLSAYKTKYFDRFSTKNLLRLNQLISIANRFAKFMTKSNGSKDTAETNGEFSSQMVFTHDLLDDLNVAHGNLYEILKFCDETRLAQKIAGFALRYTDLEVILKPAEIERTAKQKQLAYLQQLVEKQQNKDKKKSNVPEANIEPVKPVENVNRLGSASVIRTFLGFLETLLEKSSDGRILISKHRTLPSKSFIKYLLLNASEPFEALVNECRTIIVAGGTMQPTTEFTTQLFQNFQHRIEEHFYGHVVASEAILPMVIAKGPRNSSFLFNYANRGNTNMMADLSMVLQNVCNVIPAGIVCFFSSYDTMEQFYKYLTDNKQLDKIELKKKVFKESRTGGGQQTEQMLTDYAKVIKTSAKCMEPGAITGALMMSVVGGKLSEGLNFSDDLGRCVCVVGLPFPNKTSPELSEKMKYLDKIATEPKSTETHVTQTFSSGEYYENLCMKAVNQCIGRAIRHINDYATVLLIDERYQQDRIQKKLPNWIRTSLKVPVNFGGVQSSLVRFFREKKTTGQ